MIEEGIIMKLLLCSDFSGVGCKWLNKFFDNLEGLNCLFVGYAQEDDFPLESSAAKVFLGLKINVINLDKDYDFKDNIDIIFVRGGNTTRLLHYLREYGQYEKIKALAEKAKIIIAERARYYAPMIGVTYNRITIRCQRTRWGSCSSKGNLNFNCLLALFPLEIIGFPTNPYIWINSLL